MENLYANSHEALVVGLARNGDRDAFGELVRRRQASLRALLLRASGDPNLSDDLCQQVFLQAWRKLGQLREASTFGAWLRRLAVNEWLQFLRKNDVLRDSLENDEEAAAEQCQSLARDLDEALQLLTPTVRLCIVLSYQEQLSHSDISELTGLAPGTVKSHIRRGAERLRKYLAAYRNEEEST